MLLGLAIRYGQKFRLINWILTSNQFHNLLCPIVSSIFAGNGIIGESSCLLSDRRSNNILSSQGK